LGSRRTQTLDLMPLENSLCNVHVGVERADPLPEQFKRSSSNIDDYHGQAQQSSSVCGVIDGQIAKPSIPRSGRRSAAVKLRGSSARHKASVAITVENLIVMLLEIGTFIYVAGPPVLQIYHNCPADFQV
jgi:hypothetical protein